MRTIAAAQETVEERDAVDEGAVGRVQVRDANPSPRSARVAARHGRIGDPSAHASLDPTGHAKTVTLDDTFAPVLGPGDRHQRQLARGGTTSTRSVTHPSATSRPRFAGSSSRVPAVQRANRRAGLGPHSLEFAHDTNSLLPNDSHALRRKPEMTGGAHPILIVPTAAHEPGVALGGAGNTTSSRPAVHAAHVFAFVAVFSSGGRRSCRRLPATAFPQNSPLMSTGNSVGAG